MFSTRHPRVLALCLMVVIAYGLPFSVAVAAPPQGHPPCRDDHPAHVDLTHIPPCQDETPAEVPADVPADEAAVPAEPTDNQGPPPCTDHHPGTPDLTDLPPCQDQTPAEEPPIAEPPTEEPPAQEPPAETPSIEEEAPQTEELGDPQDDVAAVEPPHESLPPPPAPLAPLEPDPEDPAPSPPPFFEPANRAPFTTPIELTTRAGDDLIFDLLDFVTDPEGGALSALAHTTPTNGSVVVEGAIATYIPTPGFFGADQFTVRVCDPAAACVDVLVSVTVPPINDFLLITGSALSPFLSGAVSPLATYDVVNELLTDTARRVVVPLAGLTGVAGASLMFGLESVGNRLRQLLTALTPKS